MVLSALAAGSVSTPGPALVIPSNERVKRTANFEVDDEYSRNARSAKKTGSAMILQRRLYCQTKFSLQIRANGKVNGTRNHSSKHGE